MEGLTLLLDRKEGDLWIDMGTHIVCIWDVTGLEWNKESEYNHVRILRNGKAIGGVWHVTEIKERW